MENSISDIICLTDGRFIVLELQCKVNLLTSDGKLQKQLSIHGVAWCVTQINQNNIAITYPYEKVIKIFNMEKETVTKVITILKLCNGLSFSDNSLAVGLYKDEIRIIDMDGKTTEVNTSSEVIYCDYLGKAVYCVDVSGKQIWRYEQDLWGPWGLRTDTYGNIIVADYESTRIIVISKDGQDSQVLMSEEDRLTDPKCICFNHNQYSGFICDDNGRYLANFNLSQ
ncbi:TRIM2_3 [Mytilus coruscus]|uniref:TRIM2_3 n=1 Tax=Mytilus coruscus TaxID=42192 RepID=A0A6J8AMG7_MYTCO|nr:TRIM2_3 [Mytilus coruscus]